MQRIERIKESAGWLERYQHASSSCHCDMTFSVYLPPQAESQQVPAVYWLSGLTCSDENFREKAGAQRYAAELGLALIIPDTSPRGDAVADESDRYDLGKGAGFYVNATAAPWKQNYQMYDYITQELPALIASHFTMIAEKKSIMGHSMGGHGALICMLKNPAMYQSVSAFAPICNPIAAAWGQTCFSAYLGNNQSDWEAYDACCLIENNATSLAILVDQGTDDEFFEELHTKRLVEICDAKNIPHTIRLQEGYDHSYHFIASFIGEHLAYHANKLVS